MGSARSSAPLKAPDLGSGPPPSAPGGRDRFPCPRPPECGPEISVSRSTADGIAYRCGEGPNHVGGMARHDSDTPRPDGIQESKPLCRAGIRACRRSAGMARGDPSGRMSADPEADSAPQAARLAPASAVPTSAARTRDATQCSARPSAGRRDRRDGSACRAHRRSGDRSERGSAGAGRSADTRRAGL